MKKQTDVKILVNLKIKLVNRTELISQQKKVSEIDFPKH